MTLSLFYFLSFLSILSALMVVVSRNPVHSVLYLIITFFAIAGHYILLNAQFLAAVHVIVYAGAIMVLFLYVIMMLNLNAEVEPHKSAIQKIAATVAGGLLMIVLVGALRNAAVPAPTGTGGPQVGLIHNLGQSLYKDFMLPFEISSILFLAAMVGAVMLGKKEIK
ncbi:MAG: NADH-quinone oxidoreductase subunit J [Bacteroidia bacterium]|jgi:NADH-quinone oxidoreductase subunit J|uniref:NADH-quinone oxidoreductase subunit J family protein n=1 Tax=Candidatus Pollutiaquabacter sp. TaxID=3416354 RepID=UPI001B4CB66E|nr:NADH-quinone oxidoreductase subunit J [Bacteroidota bacterium]MBP7436250.1 NADH-quinone oxidoreductase subunit J [Bacteroidia bacterium]MBP7728353.1 NADH-quinone oxidoreductase subunit J [Bacteroidia bacterium]MBP7772889.1 NADH-quinone oxidoreductase subunit J [Bacteroidia bacterium]HRI41417.1 NADH-quinone oxidoreductase subunit J [Bacteroidia bacterium]